MKLNIHTTFFLFTVSLFMLIAAPALFSDGMFMDGLFYAAIARNMAQGIGTFWSPYLSETQFAAFYEHPPLALGLQSLGFRVFGDSIYVERFYALGTVIASGVLLAFIWKKVSGNYRFAWLPLLLWLMVADVGWGMANNMLENTMTVFVLVAVLCLLYSHGRHRWLMLAVAGLALAMGLLTKGFFCLYIWGMPFFFWLTLREVPFGKMVINTILLVLFTFLPLATLYWLWPDAQHNMLTYFNKQVVGSIENVQTVSTRFFIVLKLLENSLIPLFISLVFFLMARARVGIAVPPVRHWRVSLAFLAVVLSGVVPIMISMKQRGFYILTVYPLLAVAIAYVLYPVVERLLSKWSVTSRSFRVFKGLNIAIAAAAVVVAVAQAGRTGRDEQLVHDSKRIIAAVGRHSTIGLCPEMAGSWNLYGYYSRYGYVSLDWKQPLTHDYILTKGSCEALPMDANKYAPVQLGTEVYQLYRRVR